MIHNLDGRISLNDCNGDRTKKQQNPNLKFFIPDHDCENQILYFRNGGTEWAEFGPMKEVTRD
jgi:hypothetical protein